MQWLPLLESSLRNFAFSDTMVANAKRAYDMYMYLLYKEPNCDLGPPASVDLMCAVMVLLHSALT